ncbi:MAG: DUF3489 domain-containing protein [Erythrobacter sp.]
MTKTDTMLDTAATAADGSKATCTPKDPNKRLRSSSDAHDKQSRNALPTTVARKNADKAATASAPADEGTRNALTTGQANEARQTKASMVEALLTREGGASLDALCEATGWKPHTCRAFLTGLRKKGKEVIRASDKAGKSVYLIAPDRPPGPPPVQPQPESENC